MKIISILLILLFSSFANVDYDTPITGDVNIEITESVLVIDEAYDLLAPEACFNNNSISSEILTANSVMLFHPCCPCANGLAQCSGSEVECWNQFEDCLDELYGPEK